MLVYHRMQVLLQTAITSVRIPEKNRFFEEVLQRALFKTLVITAVFESYF